MVDITKMVAPKTDQLNADDFIGKAPFTVRITSVKATGNKEQPLAISFEGDNGKPWKPGLAMRRVLIQVWGDDVCAEAEKHFPGRAVTLYRDPDVKFGSITVGGVRVSHASNIKSEIKCTMTVSKGKRVEFPVKPLRDAPAAPQRQEQTVPKSTITPPAEKEKPPHVITGEKIIARMKEIEDATELYTYISVEALEEMEGIKAASKDAYDYVVRQYDARLKQMEGA